MPFATRSSISSTIAVFAAWSAASIMDAASTGSVYTKLNVSSVFIVKDIKEIDEKAMLPVKEEDLKQELTIDNFIDDVKL